MYNVYIFKNCLIYLITMKVNNLAIITMYFYCYLNILQYYSIKNYITLKTKLCITF